MLNIIGWAVWGLYILTFAGDVVRYFQNRSASVGKGFFDGGLAHAGQVRAFGLTLVIHIAVHAVFFFVPGLLKILVIPAQWVVAQVAAMVYFGWKWKQCRRVAERVCVATFGSSFEMEQLDATSERIMEAEQVATGVTQEQKYLLWCDFFDERELEVLAKHFLS